MSLTSISPTLDLQEAEDWISILHGDSPGLISICSTGDWRGMSFDLASEKGMTEALLYIIALNDQGREGIYLRATTVKSAPAQGRGSAAESLAFPGFWADLDIAGPGHAEANLPPSESEAYRIIAATGLPEPTLWIHSGGGLYPWWLLHNPHVVTRDLAEIQAMSEAWQRVIGAAAAKIGYKYGTGVHDLARVLRIPGTINRKEGLARPCRMFEQNGRAYSLDELKLGLQAALDRLEPPAPRPTPVVSSTVMSGLTPLDDFEARTDWSQILEPAGWSFSHQIGHTRYWCRPGKDRRDGHSATTGLDSGRDRMFVFSTATEFDAWQCVTKGYAYAVLNHGGDSSAAARDLRTKGFGSSPASEPVVIPDPMAQYQVNGHKENVPAQTKRYEHTETGNGERYVDQYGNTFQYVPQMKSWMAWNGKVWNRDEEGLKAGYQCQLMFKEMLKEAAKSGDEKDHKWAFSSGSLRRVQTAINLAKMDPEMNTDVNEFDKDVNLVTCQNGILNLKTFQLTPHDSSKLLTLAVNANYDPEAKAERFHRFMEEVLPNREIRRYVQRLLGYTLRGIPDQRVVVVLSGPSGTGKSKFTETVRHVFGMMGATAAPTTFRKHRNDNAGLDPQLHALRGSRFVATSESSDDTQLDAELVKRVTGMDQVTSRTLHEKPQSWDPRFVLWMASNYQPKAADDDMAIWSRIKTVRFEQQFTRDGSSGRVAQTDLLEELQAERDGIFAWIVEGLKDFEENGLGEPPEVTQATEEYRRDNDTVQQFVEQAVEDGTVIKKSDGFIAVKHLYSKYKSWCDDEGVIARGQTRFSRRVESLGYERSRTSQDRGFLGLFQGSGWITGNNGFSQTGLPYKQNA